MSDPLITLKIIVFGLAAFVPRYDDGLTENAATILLPDSAQHRLSSGGCGLAKHYPVLAVQAKECMVLGRGGPERCPVWDDRLALRKPLLPPHSPELVGAWNLNRKQVELKITGSGSPFRLEAPDVGRKPGRFGASWLGVVFPWLRGRGFPLSVPEASSSSWVATSPTSDEVAEDCLLGADCPITARMALETGTLETCHFSQFVDVDDLEDGTPRIWPFRLGELGWTRLWTWMHAPLGGWALADAFSVTTSGIPSDAKLTLILRRLDQPQRYRTILITPFNDGQETRIWVANVADPDAVHEHEGCYAEGIDTHFEMFYDLTRRAGRVEGLELKDRRVPRRSGPAMYEGPCKPGGFLPNLCQKLEDRYEELEEFQGWCPLLTWGAPAGYGPQTMDWTHCGGRKYRASIRAGYPRK